MGGVEALRGEQVKVTFLHNFGKRRGRKMLTSIMTLKYNRVGRVPKHRKANKAGRGLNNT